MWSFTSFYVIVTTKLVFCSLCSEGYFSKERRQCIDCPEHCLFCDSSKSCSSCKDGYWGNICELPCSRCQRGTSCEKTNGFCFEKCKDGYTGILCDAFCNDKCLNCDRMNAGLCDLCALGRYGESCDKRCPNLCNNNACNDSGYCTYDCVSGYWGPKCEYNCSSNCKNNSCNNQTGACTYGCNGNFSGSKCDRVKTNVEVDMPRNNGEENDEKPASDDKDEGQPANNDKSGQENEANRQGGENWPVILTVFPLLIVGVLVIVSIVICKKFIKPRQRGRLQQAESEEPTASPLLETTEVNTLKHLGVFSQESAPTSQTKDTVKLLEAGTALYINNDPSKEQLEKIPIIPVFPEDKKELCAPHITPGSGIFKGSDYVTDFTGNRAYIVFKAPTNNPNEYASGLLKLVWNEKCGIIVTLNQTEEGIKSLDKRNEATARFSATVTEMFFDNYTRRTLYVETSMENRKLEQMHFKKWSSGDIPENEDDLLDFCQKVHELPTELKGPLLVLCSNGVSRSRLFIALDMVLKELGRQSDVSKVKCLELLLAEKLISSGEQYSFLVRTIAKWNKPTSSGHESRLTYADE